MTLTTMGCTLADVITEQIHEALSDIDEIKKLEVKLVWCPAWTTDRMSRYARISLGIRQKGFFVNFRLAKDFFVI